MAIRYYYLPIIALVAITTPLCAQVPVEEIRNAFNRWAKIQATLVEADIAYSNHIYEAIATDAEKSDCRFATNAFKTWTTLKDKEIEAYRQARDLDKDLKVVIVEAWNTQHKQELIKVLNELAKLMTNLHANEFFDSASWRPDGFAKRIGSSRENLSSHVDRKCSS